MDDAHPRDHPHSDKIYRMYPDISRKPEYLHMDKPLITGPYPHHDDANLNAYVSDKSYEMRFKPIH